MLEGDLEVSESEEDLKSILKYLSSLSDKFFSKFSVIFIAQICFLLLLKGKVGLLHTAIFSNSKTQTFVKL